MEAFQLTEQARQAELSDPDTAYRKYRTALAKIDDIITNYSATRIAVDATQYRTRIGEITIGELREKVPLFKARSAALEGFHELATYVMELNTDELQQLLNRLQYAAMLYATATGSDEAYNELIQRIIHQAERHWNREIRDRVFHEVSVHFAKTGSWDRAFVMADRVQDQRLLYQSLLEIINSGYVAEYRASSLEKLLPLFDYILPAKQIRLMQLIAHDLFIANENEAALSLLERGYSSGSDDRQLLDHIEALNRLSSLFASKGEFDASRSIIKAIKALDKDYSDFALRELAAQLAYHGEREKAIQIADSLERDYFRHTTKAFISVQLARTDSLHVALELLGSIPDNLSEKKESYLEIAGIYARLQENIIADSLVALALSDVASIDSEMRRAAFFIKMADIHIIQNKFTQAAGALEEAELSAKEITEPSQRNRLVGQIIMKWIDLGRTDRALDIAAWFGMQDTSLHQIIEEIFHHALRREYHDFVRILAGITDDIPKYLFLLTSAYLDNQNLSRAVDLAYDIRNYYLRSKILAKISHDFRKNNDTHASEKAATDALLAIQRIREPSLIRDALFHVSSALSVSGIEMNDERKSLTIQLLNDLSTSMH